jgi:hypothetical protein
MRKLRFVAVGFLILVGAGGCRLDEVPWGPPPPGPVCYKGEFAKCNPKQFREEPCSRCTREGGSA